MPPDPLPGLAAALRGLTHEATILPDLYPRDPDTLCCFRRVSSASSETDLNRLTSTFPRYDQRRVMTSDRQASAVAPGVAGIGATASFT